MTKKLKEYELGEFSWIQSSGSTWKFEPKVEYEGKEHPVLDLELSSWKKSIEESPSRTHWSLVRKVMLDSFGVQYFINDDMEADCTDKEVAINRYDLAWAFNFPSGTIGVLVRWDSWSLDFFGDSDELPPMLLEEAKNLRAVIVNEVAKLPIPKNTLDKDVVERTVLNTFHMHDQTTADLLTQARNVIGEIRNCERSDKPEDRHQCNVKDKIVASLLRSALISSFVSLEGFVNVIYTLLKKPEYRGEIYDRSIRNDLVFKILEMAHFCDGFVRAPLRQSDELIKAIQHFVLLRNLLIHANITEDMATSLIYQDDEPLWIRGPTAKEQYGIARDLHSLSTATASRARRLVRKFVVKVVQSMRPDVQRVFITEHDCSWITYGKKILEEHKVLEDRERIGIEKGEGFIVTEEDDRKKVAAFLRESAQLDTDYYHPGEEEYVPKFH